jgi:hypothetical protein
LEVGAFQILAFSYQYPNIVFLGKCVEKSRSAKPRHEEYNKRSQLPSQKMQSNRQVT